MSLVHLREDHWGLGAFPNKTPESFVTSFICTNLSTARLRYHLHEQKLQ